MRKIQIMTDSASDISYADEKKYNITVIPFPITLGDKTYTSRVDFDNEQFYEWMAQYDEIHKNLADYALSVSGDLITVGEGRCHRPDSGIDQFQGLLHL